MVRRSQRVSQNTKSIVVWSAIVVGILMLLWGVFTILARPTKEYVSVVIASDPMLVLTLDTVDRSGVLVEIPAGTTIEGVHGYGVYSLEALWKLGDLDKKDGVVLAESVEEALGIPVRWYIGAVNNTLLPGTGGLNGLRQVLTYANIFSTFQGNQRTNMSPVDYFRLVTALKSLRVDDIRIIRITENNALYEEERSDDSKSIRLDPQRADILLGNTFEREEIRNEKHDVIVENTTSTSGIAQRVSRLLGRLGVVVISLTSSDAPIDRCEVRGTEEILKSKTSRLIELVYGCSLVVDTSLDRSDILLKVGTEYEGRFFAITDKNK